MNKIKDILSLNLTEDIKNVIDLEDRSELETQQEIESYIVTEGIGAHLSTFANQFTSNIKETGVWVSGFYGSGKSYFGKMLGYILSNPLINGTSVIDRFIPRLKGVSNESLIENDLRKLSGMNNRVVFLDVAKQNTDNGLSFTLFANFLKSLGFRDDLYGYMEFELLVEGKHEQFLKIANKLSENAWKQVRSSNSQIAKNMRHIFSEMGYSETDYNDTKKVFEEAIQSFSASKLKEALEKYIDFNKDEVIVFIFDEASEAISQKKFTLLDLEGLSEALSSISHKVWTIAIAQEKLDDVINNANVSKSQLTKVTDRFKTKLHLESTEVDVIIRSRLLQKKDEHFKPLLDFYRQNEGLISDATNLKSTVPTKTKSAEEFAVYYPFHRYQFDVLQKFLFTSNSLVATQIAARGMIITAFDVLRKHLQNKQLHEFTTAYEICTEAQTAPPTSLGLKYETAMKILGNARSDIDGQQLLKTIHLLSDAEVVSATIENITKSYVSDLQDYYEYKPKIQDALERLVDAKQLLLTNHQYKITSDLESKMLEEMKDFDVELYVKKRELVNHIKKTALFNPVSSVADGSESFKFNVLSDLGDDISGSSNKNLKLVVYSLFNISEDRQDFVEGIKLETQTNKDTITLIPDNQEFALIDKLLTEIKRYEYMEEKYANDHDQDKRQIIRDFTLIKEEKEKNVRAKIEQAYTSGSLVYLFDEHLLNRDGFKTSIQDIQRKIIKNVYTKRIGSQLSESLAPKVLKDGKTILHRNFSGDDFKFFDSNGNFTGDHLKVVEEITAKIKNKYVDGRSLEEALSGPPWGFAYGTIITTLSVLFRAGKLGVKFNGQSYFSYDDATVHDVFKTSSRFKTAQFKGLSVVLSAQQKNQAVQILQDLEYSTHTKKKVTWSSNDFEIAESITILADYFIAVISALHETVEGFVQLFPKVLEQKKVLQSFSNRTTESNYIDKVTYLLDHKAEFSESIQVILKAQKFIKTNFEKVKSYKKFIQDVLAELAKANKSILEVKDEAAEFDRLYQQDMVKHFNQLQQCTQTIKDAYYKSMKSSADNMVVIYASLLNKIDSAEYELKGYPADANQTQSQKLNQLRSYSEARLSNDIQLDYNIVCKKSGYSLSDIMNYIELAALKETELIQIQASFIQTTPQIPQTRFDSSGDVPEPPQIKSPRKIRLRIDKQIMSVQEYKNLLTQQLTGLAQSNPHDEIELIVETLQESIRA